MNFGIISPPVPGHLYPNGMIAKELINRGHQVTIYNIIDTKEFIENLGITFFPVAEKQFPINSWAKYWQSARTGSNLFRDLHVLKMHIRIAKQMLYELPIVLKQQKIDVLLVDQLQPQGAALAMRMGIPFITVCSILPIHIQFNGHTPPAFAWWQPSKNPLIKLANIMGHFLTGILVLPYLKIVNKSMKMWNLPIFKNLEQTFSKQLQIGVIPNIFDFPKPNLNPVYQSFGPFVQTRENIHFPWHKLDNRPLIYVSMGTIRNSIQKVYNALLPVLAKFSDFQVVISKGAWTGEGINLGNIPDNVLVVDYAPQLDLLKQAVLCITHAGPGTVLESLYFGVPMVCIPFSDDQPAMAARVKYFVVGEVVPWKKLTKKRLFAAISNVLNIKSYKNNCMAISEKIKLNSGVQKAADAIERTLENIFNS